MLKFTDGFLGFLNYCTPGAVAVVPYWFTWRLKRSFGDYAVTFIYAVGSRRTFETAGGLILTFMFGSKLIFGEFGPTVCTVVLSVMAVPSGIWAGWHGRNLAKENPKIYPWRPLRFR